MYLLLIMSVVMLIIFFGNITAASRSFGAYYKEKRAKFPWLEKWIKERRVNPARTRANEATNNSIALFAIMYLGISIILGWILNSIVRLIVEKGFSVHLLPSDWKYILYTNIGSVLAIIFAIIVSTKASKLTAESPEISGSDYGIDLECPSCHCPHSWVLVREQDIVEDEKIEKITTTTTSRESGDNYGGGAIGEMFASATSRSSTSTIIITTAIGKLHKYFQCLNCGNTKRTEESKNWKYKEWEYDKKPRENAIEYNPPQDSWIVAKGIKARFTSVVLVAVMIIIILISVFSILLTVNYKKEAAKIEEKSKAVPTEVTQ